MRRLILVLAVIAAVAAACTTARAATNIGDVAASLRQDPVFDESDAERALSASDANELRRRIRNAGTPIFVAILPQRAIRASGAGNPEALVARIARATGLDGSYAVVAGSSFAAGNTGDLHGVPEQATLAFQSHRDQGTRAVLDDWVGRVGDLAGGRSPDSGGGGGGRSFGSAIPTLIVAGSVVFMGFSLVRRRRRRRRWKQTAAELAEVKAVANQDLSRLQQDVIDLDTVHQPGRDPDVDAEYVAATDRLQEATLRLARARSLRDLGGVSRAIADGRYRIACARARIEGRPAPERTAPCFFDPQHGPSTQQVWWAPPDGGQPRQVPACDVCAHQVEEGREPAARQILVAGQQRPYWAAPRYYGPWVGGYYGGVGYGPTDLFTGLLLGEALSSGFGYGGPVFIDDDGQFVDASGNPDFGGGGDWGGGGGDWGGGGGGGGDWGGGGDFGGGGGDFGGGGGDGGSW